MHSLNVDVFRRMTCSTMYDVCGLQKGLEICRSGMASRRARYKGDGGGRKRTRSPAIGCWPAWSLEALQGEITLEDRKHQYDAAKKASIDGRVIFP